MSPNAVAHHFTQGISVKYLVIKLMCCRTSKAWQYEEDGGLSPSAGERCAHQQEPTRSLGLMLSFLSSM